MNKKESIAKVVRVISVPPVMITTLVVILCFFKSDVFRNPLEIAIAIILLGFVPILAYPLQKVIPKLKDKGRDGQRKLAFITNMIGYSAAFIWSVVAGVSSILLLVCSTYFFSVVFLSICNLLHFKASGHASSFTGPLLILVYSFGLKMVLPCLLIAAIIFWSSLITKRHTVNQLIGGMMVCLVSFVISVILITNNQI